MQRRNEGVVEANAGERSGIEADGEGNHDRMRKVALFDDPVGFSDALVQWSRTRVVVKKRLVLLSHIYLSLHIYIY